MESRHTAQEILVSIEALGRLALDALDLCLLQSWGDRSTDLAGDLILQIEDVLCLPLESIRPQMDLCQNINQLCRDANPIAGLAHASFEYVLNPSLLAHLLGMHP